MAQRSGRRRALADLLPATLATGAAGLVVSLVVGGTTAGLQSALRPPGGGAAPNVVATAGLDDAVAVRRGVTVSVRPKLPAAIGVVAALDLLPAPALARSASAGDAGPRSPSVVLASSSTRRETPAVPVMVLAAVPASAELAAASTDTAAPAMATPAKSKPKARTTARTDRLAGDGVVALGSGSRVAADGLAATTAPDATKPTPRSKHEAPPPHAPAHGYRR